MPLTSLVLLAVLLPLVVIGLAPYPFLTLFVLLALGIWVLYSANPGEHWTILFLLAAFFGTLGEHYCVTGSWTTFGDGLWNYHFPKTFGWELPIWIPLIWGNLFVFFAGTGNFLSPSYDVTLDQWWIKTLRFLAVLFIVAYAGVMYRSIKVEILYVLTPLLTLFLTFWTHPRDLMIYYVGAFGGSVGEILAMRWELWSYTVPMFQNWLTDLLGVPGLPVSLAMAWGMSTVFLNRTALALEPLVRSLGSKS